MHWRKRLNSGRWQIGFIPEAAIVALLASVSMVDASDNSVRAAPSFFQTTGFYWLCGAGVIAIIAVGWRLVIRWRRRAKRLRDEEIFRLVDQWTKSLQQEVAERKQAQRALQESQDWIMRQERLAAAGQLAAGLAHEFNNILTVVQGHAFLLLNNPSLDEESLKSVNHINEGVERTARLIKQMLALSRKQVMMRKPLDMQENLDQTAEMLNRVLSEQVTLNFEIAPNLPPIMADAEMFQQIILNLVVNARDAMSSGGRLTIRANEAKFNGSDLPAKSNRKPGRFVRLSVADTGSGMDTTIISHLFEPFFTTKDVGKGTGLGLATVHGMVNQHEGWIEVQSEIGKGTCFDIYFPIAEEAPRKEFAHVDANAIRGGKETILMVEDQEALRQLVREVLQSHGYQVLEAPTGAKAFQLWETAQSKVDLLLMDISTHQDDSGMQMANRFWKDSPRLPVIFIYDNNKDAIQNNGPSNQTVTYLSKPYGPAQLIRAVREALDVVAAPALK